MNIANKLNKMFNLKNKEQTISKEDYLKYKLDEFMYSEKRQLMLIGQKYYENNNEINERKRLVIGEGGYLFEDKNLSNQKLSHPFIRKLIEQKTQYIFGRPFTIRTKNEEYTKLIYQIFDDNFRRDIKNVCKECINKGISYLQVYFYDNEIKFKKINSEELIPIWGDSDHTWLESIIRIYKEKIYKANGKVSYITKIKWYTLNGIENFIYENNKIKVDEDCPYEYHYTIDGVGYNFDRIPFVYFKYNEEEIPLIKYIKSLIDDYDLLTSEDSNTILDQPNSILVLTNYDGENLGEFRQNLSKYKAVKVTDGGGVDFKNVSINTEAINQHIQLIRRDIYELGRGVDTQNERVGKATGVALKFLYADLDLDCNNIETEFKSSFQYLMKFVDKFLEISTNKKFYDFGIEFVLNRRMIINESEAIVDCMNSVNVIDNQTIRLNHPWVNNTTEY